jgi:hypothetical protein
MLECFHSEEAASCAYKSSPDKPEPNIGAASTAVSGWATDAYNDLRALILCKRGYHNSKTGAEAQVMSLEEIRSERNHTKGTIIPLRNKKKAIKEENHRYCRWPSSKEKETDVTHFHLIRRI